MILAASLAWLGTIPLAATVILFALIWRDHRRTRREHADMAQRDREALANRSPICSHGIPMNEDCPHCPSMARRIYILHARRNEIRPPRRDGDATQSRKDGEAGQ